MAAKESALRHLPIEVSMSIRKRFGMIGIFAACISMLHPVSAQTVTLKIQNTSEVGIFSIYMSRPDHAAGETDTLGNGKLAPGTAITITGIAPGSYDMKLLDENGNSCVIHNFK